MLKPKVTIKTRISSSPRVVIKPMRGSSSTGSGTIENLSSQCDGSTTVFTTTSNSGIFWLTLNGTMLVEGKEFTRDSATQITLTFAPDTGEELYLKYL